MVKEKNTLIGKDKKNYEVVQTPQLNKVRGPFSNKKGWIKIIEAFISILLLISVIVIVIQDDNLYSKKEQVLQKKQAEILNGIQVNSALRSDVLGILTHPIDSNDAGFPLILKSYLDSKPIANTDCLLMVCLPQNNCNIEIDKSQVFSKDVLIASSLTEYNAKVVKIFCYSK